MDYVINTWWLILLIFSSFTLGMISGLKVMKEKITMKLLKEMNIEEIKRLMEK